MKISALIAFVLFLVTTGWVCNASASQDPWVMLQEQFKNKEVLPQPSPPLKKVQLKKDPWIMLRSVFLPFSQKEEQQARTDVRAAKTVALKINQQIAPFETIIFQAAERFNIPTVVIKSVIMVESGANPDAKTTLSSAKGLMQTIDSTFNMARKNLKKQGINIADDPFDPHASIMAGSWYLDRMYKKALNDKKIKVAARQNIASWRYPLEYYYAGPAHGAKAKNKILVFSKGTKRIIDKRAYSKKIESWAKILKRS